MAYTKFDPISSVADLDRRHVKKETEIVIHVAVWKIFPLFSVKRKQ